MQFQRCENYEPAWCIRLRQGSSCPRRHCSKTPFCWTPTRSWYYYIHRTLRIPQHWRAHAKSYDGPLYKLQRLDVQSRSPDGLLFISQPVSLYHTLSKATYPTCYTTHSENPYIARSALDCLVVQAPFPSDAHGNRLLPTIRKLYGSIYQHPSPITFALP